MQVAESRPHLLRFIGTGTGVKSEREIDGGPDGAPDIRICYPDGKSRVSAFPGRSYWVRICGENPKRTVWYVELIEECAVPTRLFMGDSVVLSCYLPDGRPANLGQHYDEFPTIAGEPAVAVVVPAYIELWLLVDLTRPYRGGSDKTIWLQGVHASGHDKTTTSYEFSSPFSQSRSQPACPRGVPSAVYEAVIASVDGDIRRRWEVAAGEIEEERKEAELTAARSQAAELKERATRLRGRCSGDEAGSAVRAQLDTFILYDSSRAGIFEVETWNHEALLVLDAAESVLVAAEETELAPILRIRGVSGRVHARAVRGCARKYLKEAGGDVTRAIKSLKSQWEANKKFKAGEDFALAIVVLTQGLVGIEDTADTLVSTGGEQ